jgi:hypothetical protein
MARKSLLLFLLLIAIQTSSSSALLSAPDFNPLYPKAISVSLSFAKSILFFFVFRFGF